MDQSKHDVLDSVRRLSELANDVPAGPTKVALLTELDKLRASLTAVGIVE